MTMISTMNKEPSLTLATLARRLQADCPKPLGDRPWRQLACDSRSVQPGDVFIALKGQQTDGHRFIQDAIDRGAVAVVVSHGQTDDVSVPILKVADTEAALMAAAKRLIAEYTGTTVAITGSYGKTTTRHVLATLLATHRSVWSPTGNRNTPLGIALSLMTSSGQEDYWVVEMGTSSPGEISRLVDLMQPNVALITTIENAHLENFASKKALILEKTSIFSRLSDRDAAIVNGDQAWVQQDLPWKSHTRICMVSSETCQGDYFMVSQDIDSRGRYKFEVASPQGRHRVTMPLLGGHHRQTVLNVCALLDVVGEKIDDYRSAWLELQAFAHRLQLIKHNNPWRLIDDSYNANPASARAAIDVLSEQPGTRVLVLADMLELGEEQEALHREVGAYAKGRVDRLYTLGLLAGLAADSWGEQAQSYHDQEQLIQDLLRDIRPDWSVLVKGSRATRMDLVVKALSGRLHLEAVVDDD